MGNFFSSTAKAESGATTGAYKEDARQHATGHSGHPIQPPPVSTTDTGEGALSWLRRFPLSPGRHIIPDFVVVEGDFSDDRPSHPAPDRPAHGVASPSSSGAKRPATPAAVRHESVPADPNAALKKKLATCALCQIVSNRDSSLDEILDAMGEVFQVPEGEGPQVQQLMAELPSAESKDFARGHLRRAMLVYLYVRLGDGPETRQLQEQAQAIAQETEISGIERNERMRAAIATALRPATPPVEFQPAEYDGPFVRTATLAWDHSLCRTLRDESTSNELILTLMGAVFSPSPAAQPEVASALRLLAADAEKAEGDDLQVNDALTVLRDAMVRSLCLRLKDARAQEDLMTTMQQTGGGTFLDPGGCDQMLEAVGRAIGVIAGPLAMNVVQRAIHGSGLLKDTLKEARDVLKVMVGKVAWPPHSFLDASVVSYPVAAAVEAARAQLMSQLEGQGITAGRADALVLACLAQQVASLLPVTPAARRHQVQLTVLMDQLTQLTQNRWTAPAVAALCWALTSERPQDELQRQFANSHRAADMQPHLEAMLHHVRQVVLQGAPIRDADGGSPIQGYVRAHCRRVRPWSMPAEDLQDIFAAEMRSELDALVGNLRAPENVRHALLAEFETAVRHENRSPLVIEGSVLGKVMSTQHEAFWRIHGDTCQAAASLRDAINAVRDGDGNVDLLVLMQAAWDALYPAFELTERHPSRAAAIKQVAGSASLQLKFHPAQVGALELVARRLIQELAATEAQATTGVSR